MDKNKGIKKVLGNKNLMGFIFIILILFLVFIFNVELGFSAFEDLGTRVSFIFVIGSLFFILAFFIFILVIKNKNKK